MKSLKSSKKRILLIASLLLIVAGLISALAMTAVAGKSQETQTAQSEITISPTLTSAPLLLPPPLTPAPLPSPPPELSETQCVVEELHLAGPETRGIEWLIGGKKVKLPEDAELGGQTMYNHSPLLHIIRGNSTMYIGQTTGKVYFCSIARGEEAAFDFIKQSFPDQAEIIDSFPVKASDEVSK